MLDFNNERQHEWLPLDFTLARGMFSGSVSLRPRFTISWHWQWGHRPSDWPRPKNLPHIWIMRKPVRQSFRDALKPSNLERYSQWMRSEELKERAQQFDERLAMLRRVRGYLGDEVLRSRSDDERFDARLAAYQTVRQLMVEVQKDGEALLREIGAWSADRD